MSIFIKICGITSPEAVEASQKADYLGFIFYPPSPRNVSIEQASRLAAQSKLPAVAVTVNASDSFLQEIVERMKPDYIQLHGTEYPERVKKIRSVWNIPVIKAFSVRTAEDVKIAHTYNDAADMLLFDAKPLSSMLPGGTGETFNWELLVDEHFAKPWFLSGGLDSSNISEAIRVSGANYVDVSSRLESAPGIKDPQKIHQFIEVCREIAPNKANLS